MLKLNIFVHRPKGSKDAFLKRKKFEWPVVPSKGQKVNLGERDCAGVDVRVIDVGHWFGTGDIDVECSIDKEHTDHHAVYRSLSREQGWSWDP